MKNLITTIFLMLGCITLLKAQQSIKPSDITRLATNATQALTSQTARNYIRSYTYRDADDTVFSKTYNINIDIQYFDGLGRPVETVQLAASPMGKDIVSAQTYDAYGRADKSYIPYASATSGGIYVAETDVNTAMPAYLSSNFDLIGTDNQFGFSKPLYESSPLNRVLQQGAPGTEWQPGTYPTVHPVQTDYQINTTAIASWNYNGDTPISFSYAVGTLYVTLTTDEDGKQSKTYTDFEGKVVMKEVNDGSVWLQTRYCYDDFGLLRCVLQPMATDPTTSIEYCFYYKYDSRKRMTDKKVPGSDWVYMIYDKRDRLVLTSDGNSRTTNKWYYTTYDDFNRPTQTGFFKTTASRETLTTYYASNLTQYASGRVDERMVYDKHNQSYPYNNYQFAANDLVLASDTAVSNKGLLVCKQARTILGDDSVPIDLSMAAVYYYNKYGWMIQSVEQTYYQGFDRTSNKYNFTGQIIQSRVEHNFNGTTNPYTVNIYYKYDHRGRLLQTDYKVDTNGNDVEQTIVSANVYNEAGQLKTKYLHSKAGEAFIQKIDYKYNIRGWLTAINDPTLSTTEGDKFGTKIGYNKLPDGTTTGLWNGNISGIKWSTLSYRNREYNYTYDGVNRLLSAFFKESGVGNAKNNSTYSYDKNGNFNTLIQFGNNSVPIDQLTYGYETKSNQLKYVIDYMGDAVGVEDFPGTITDNLKHFFYDANGNLTFDGYRSLNISYNRFNLPFLMDFGSNKKVNYIYNGSGKKLFREVANGTNPKIHTDYIGMFVHENTATTASSLKYIFTPEGRIINSGTDAAPIWSWEYNLTDHLGNVRVVIAPKASVGYANVIQETSYFPFGMVMSGISSFTSKNKYLYNGKEQQTDFGLNWYDYGARFYDPAIGRFTTPDPLAETYNNQSPYLYAHNNPIRYTDYLGLGEEDEVAKDKDKKKKEEEANKKEEDNKKEAEKKKEDEKKKEEEAKKKENEDDSNKDVEDRQTPAEQIYYGGMALSYGLCAIDGPEPGPGDAAGITYAGATIITAGIVWTGYSIYQMAKSKPGKSGEVKGAEHTSGASKSKENVHEEGQTRKQQVNRDKKRQKGNWTQK